MFNWKEMLGTKVEFEQAQREREIAAENLAEDTNREADCHASPEDGCECGQHLED